MSIIFFDNDNLTGIILAGWISEPGDPEAVFNQYPQDMESPSFLLWKLDLFDRRWMWKVDIYFLIPCGYKTCQAWTSYT